MHLAPALADQMRLRNQLPTQQLGHRGRVHRIGLDLGVADGLEIFRTGEPEVNALRHQQIPHPVPQAGALADGLVWPVERVDGQGPLVQIDAGVAHAEGLGEKGGRRLSRRRGSLGISLRCA